jgi:hypothetical protein
VSIPAHIEQRAEQIVQEHDRQINERNATMTTRQKGRAVPPKRTLLPMPTHNLTLPDTRIARNPGENVSLACVANGRLACICHARHHAALGAAAACVNIDTARSGTQTWEEIKTIRAAFYPLDRDAMMVLPREEDYVNVHANTFHPRGQSTRTGGCRNRSGAWSGSGVNVGVERE